LTGCQKLRPRGEVTTTCPAHAYVPEVQHAYALGHG
jgi:hypothetical protein